MVGMGGRAVPTMKSAFPVRESLFRRTTARRNVAVGKPEFRAAIDATGADQRQAQ
jgi:hypothetical protein